VAVLSRRRLLGHLRAKAFALGVPVPPLRIGAEAELIPIRAGTGNPVPIDGPGGSLPFLRRFAARRGWREVPCASGAPHFALPDGGVVSYEPGGQVELSTPPFASGTALLAALRSTMDPLVAAAADEGIVMLASGIEPRNPVERVPLQLRGTRYARLDAFLRGIGTGGERMMRQTAAFQVSLDAGPDPLARWRFLNALAPFATAVFARSPVYRGAPTGHRSYRAHVWRELDGGRTGIFAAADDPVGEYADFALRAPAILLGQAGAPALPFACWGERGAAGLEDWRAHLSTLFPEVRPRGCFEVRSVDALPPGEYAAPLVFLVGCTYPPAAFREAVEIAGEPDPGLLEVAGRDGVAHPEIGPGARALAEVALEGARGMAPGFFSAADLDAAEAFFARYTFRGRAPADDLVLEAAQAVA
jgi:glutamate--cysteine ligase